MQVVEKFRAVPRQDVILTKNGSVYDFDKTMIQQSQTLIDLSFWTCCIVWMVLFIFVQCKQPSFIQKWVTDSSKHIRFHCVRDHLWCLWVQRCSTPVLFASLLLASFLCLLPLHLHACIPTCDWPSFLFSRVYICNTTVFLTSAPCYHYRPECRL